MFPSEIAHALATAYLGSPVPLRIAGSGQEINTLGWVVASVPEEAAPRPVSEEERRATERMLRTLMEAAGGYYAIWTLDLGLVHGFWAILADRPEGLTPRELAARGGWDLRYIETWCRAAYAAGLLEAEEGRFRMAEGLRAPLLEPDSPVYFGGLVRFLTALRERFLHLREHMADGQRSWWDAADPELMEGVADSSRTFYTRLLRKGFRQVPGLVDRLSQGALQMVELACGRGIGLVRIAAQYPLLPLAGVDSDPASLAAAQTGLERAGLAGRVPLTRASFETGPLPPADVYLVNLALHEARNPPGALRTIREHLRPGGVLLVSEFPFPAELPGLRDPSGRLMSGAQYLEATLDDSFLTQEEVVTLLRSAGFRDVGSASLAPVHVLIWGWK